MEKHNDMGIALTFDDIRMKTMHSSVMPGDVNLKTKFSKNIWLNIPIVSAAMDTVTEHKLAIELAKLGGIGIIHKNLSPEEQAREVSKVKHNLNGLIDKPISVSADDTIKQVKMMISERGFSFNSFPVLDKNKKLVGILSGNDFDFCDDNQKKVKDVMTKGIISAPEKTTLSEAYEIMKKEKKKILPLVNQKNELKGLYTFKDLKGIKSGKFSQYNTDKNEQLIVGAAIGVGEENIKRAKMLIEKNVDVLVIDTAHGDTNAVIETLKKLKKLFPKKDVVVGNITEPESAKKLIEAGADGIKVGQGPGSICTTRIIAGIGTPQVTAIYNVAKIASEHDIPVCADGGLKHSGDIPIAIGVGAHTVMMGSMLAGTKEAPGELVFKNGRQWKTYRGMGSIGAMNDHKESRERYLEEDKGKDKLVPEGVEGLTPFKGNLAAVVHQYIGGLRKGMGYIGAKDIESLREKADFWRITDSGKKESHPHDIEITKESPNYNINK